GGGSGWQQEWLHTMQLQVGLLCSSARIMASMSCILEQYNHPFENDILISMSTLTYDAPDGPKRNTWDGPGTAPDPNERGSEPVAP
uniref:Uncharacterized protein n=1 Tax=Serinus canaria TaxID=9135 RepID=A0A8C9NR52_SERCA